MAKLSLRQYTKEIERLIENSRTDEAIAHCRYILQTYPRCIDAYRLLGKAFLESQRFGDAADIFQRVLSSIPDDFVAHVGMSIIREDEGNLDEAIWHMERAFESQPSNGAIQDELRRLYGRRDGVEPPKIHLTRGALARMYVKGDLLHQAVAELRAALAEDPKRIDLRLLLSTVLFETGQRIEAADMAGVILRKLPNCLEANRIMAQVLTESERKAEAQTYSERIIGMDPYYEFITESIPKPGQVHEEAISFDKLEWKPGQVPAGMPGQPAWATSLGIEIGEAQADQEELPEWLSGVSKEQPAEVAPSQIPALEEPDMPPLVPAREGEEELPAFLSDLEETPSTPSIEGPIPDWMKDAGWVPSSGAAEEIESAPVLEAAITEPDTEDMDIEKGDIPEWVQAMAPLEIEEEPPAPDEDIAPWLEEMLPAEDTEEEIAPPEAMPEMDLALEQHEGLLDEEPATSASELAESESSEELPDWLQEEQVEAPVPSPISEEPLAEEDESQEELPDWLIDEGASEEIKTTPEAEPTVKVDSGVWLPPWLTDQETPADQPEQQEVEVDEEITASEDLPDWLLDAEPEAVEQVTPEGVELPAGADQEEETLPWLREEEPAAGQSAPEESEGPAEIEAIPDWWLEDEQPLEEMPAPPPDTEGAGELPPWLVDEGPMPVEPEPTDVEPTEEAQTEEKLPDWFYEEEPGKALEAATDEVVSDIGDEGVEELPEWLLEEEPAAELESEPPSPEQEVAGEIEEQLPDWLLEDEMPLIEPEPPTEEAAAFVPTTEKLPDWLLEGEAPPETEPVPMDAEPEAVEKIESEALAGEALTEWLDTVEQEAPVEEESKPEQILTFEDVESTADQDIQATPPAVEEVEGTPSEMLEHTQVVEEPSEAEETSIEDEAAFAWLESLAVKQGAEEALLLEPEERQEVPPDWVQAAVAEDEITEEAMVPPPPAEDITDIEPEAPFELAEEPVAEIEAEIEERTGEEEAEPVLVSMEEEPAHLELEPEEPVEVTPEPIPGIEEEILEVAMEETPSIQEIVAETEEVEIEEPVPEKSILETEEILTEEAPVEEILMEKEISEEPVAEEFTAEEAIEVEGVQEEEITEELPDLPDWLTESAIFPKEVLEWQPPPVIDLNLASLAELERLPGMGFILAQSIIDHREKNGPFLDLEELLLVSGFTDDIFEGVKDRLFVETPEELPEASEEELGIFPVEEDAPEELVAARQALEAENLDEALEGYNQLILASESLTSVIRDLQIASELHPSRYDILQSLGDAYIRNDQVQEALHAYLEAEKTFR